MSRWLPIVPVLALAACPTTHDDTDHVVETDTDTDVECRGCDSDSEILSTDVPVDTDPEETGDTSTRVDTFKGCLLGEVADCTGACFPEWMLGDGTCDNAVRFDADFDCPAFAFDQGDCVSDTDTDEETGVAGGGCGHYRLEFHTVIWPTEIAWNIDKLNSFGGFEQRNLYVVTAGTYTNDYTVYVHDNLYLPPGKYQLAGRDESSPWYDGWHGAYWYLIDETTGMAAARGGAPDTPLAPGYGPGGGAYRTWYFDTTCEHDTCDVDISTLGGTGAQEMAWELYNNADRLVAERGAGTVTPGGTTTDTLNLYEGTYTLRTRDLGGDGWGGGRTEVRYDGGLLLRADGLYAGSNGTGSFTVNCDHAATGAFDAPGAPLQLSSCQGVKLAVTERGQAPGDVGWSLYRVSDWKPLLSRPPGSYTSGGLSDAVDLESGLYYVQQVDAGANGWQNARLRLEDPNGTTLWTAVLPQGASTGRYFEAVCPPPVIDTDAGHTDTDSDPPPAPTCLPFARPDCDGVCMPRAFLGDGYCDDGLQSSADFACASTGYDGGDCPAPQQP